MAEARDIPAGTYDLKLGETFQDKTDKAAYHTLRFDFKPKSVASETETYLAFGGNGDVQVAVPGEGDSLTIYKGARKPVKADKECLLFFDHNTGELRLEKLSSNINVKKTRDTDEATVSAIRGEIQKLRRKAKPKSKQTAVDDNEDEDMDETKSSSGSSSSSSSDSGDSDSDSSSSSTGRRRAAGGNNKEREAESTDDDNNTASGSNDDDDLQDQLEQHLNAPDSMPSIDTAQGYHAPTKQQPNYQPSNHHHHNNSKKLLDDLQLSESSDDD